MVVIPQSSGSNKSLTGAAKLTKVNLTRPAAKSKTGGVWTRGRIAVAALCLIGLAFNALMVGPSLVITANGLTDFMDLYAGGKLAFDRHLYEPLHLMAAQAAAEGWSSPTRLFMRLPCFAVFYWPLAQLPYRAASAVWEILCVVGLIAFCRLWPARRKWHAVLAACASLPAWMVVAEGQDLALVLVVMAGTALLIRRRQPVLAGQLASLCLAKFHLFLLVPVWLCARRQWSFGRGLLSGGAILLAISFVSSGLDWPFRYYALLREPANNPYIRLMPNLHSAFDGLPGAGGLEIAGLAALAAVVWRVSRRHSELGLAAALAGSLVGAPHAYMADAVLLIPAVLLLQKRATNAWIAGLGIYLLTPLPWLLLLQGVGYPAQIALCGLMAALLRHRPEAGPGRFHVGTAAGFTGTS